MAGKKETVAKVQKKVAKKTTEKPQAEVQNKTRHFSIIYGGVKLAATPSGKRYKKLQIEDDGAIKQSDFI